MADATLQPGSTFAGCRIDGELGRGGMGIVYSATELTLNRPVALKLLPPSLASDPQFRARFQRESRLAAAVSHPNVVPVYAVGEEDGLLYLVMRLIHGPGLDSLIAEGPLPPPRVVRILDQVSLGLQAAHDLGLVHRDVKPGNVLLDGDDSVYVTDFGLAIALGDRAGGPALTQTGQFVGTIDFVPPERIQGGTGDARGDIYSLGCMLYTALTGRRPFPRNSEAATLFAHISDPPPAPSELFPELAVFDVVIARAMAKQPADRHPSAVDFAAEMSSAALAAPPPPITVAAAVPAPPPPPRTADEVSDTWTAVEDVVVPVEREELPRAAAPPTYVPAPAPPSTTVVVPARPRSRRSWRWPRIQIRRRRAEAPSEVPALNGARRPTTDSLAQARRRVEAIRLPVSESFRYIHHPSAAHDDTLPLLGNEQVVLALVERILHSDGGAFLLTGFRGVGKTTVILNALEHLRSELGRDAVVPVFLNVARPKSTEELLFEVIRRLFEALVDGGVLQQLPEDIQSQLILAYKRTSLSFTQTHGSAVEASRGLGLTIPLLQALGVKVEAGDKKSSSEALEASFLAYSAADVEHDFLRIVSLFRRRGGTPQASWDGKIVVVVDELDKLTATDRGRKCLDDLVSGLKNLLTTWGVHFVFIAGPDLHDLSLRQRHRGNSVYDSVFGWQLYVPCVWQATDRLLDNMLPPGWERRVEFGSLGDYLRFKARGVPRLLLMELNALVEWEDGKPCVTLRSADRKRIEFYAGIERVLASFTGTTANGQSFSVPIDEDRWRIGAYYVTDWILRTLGRTFTVEDLIPKHGDIAFDPLLVMVPEKVEQLLEHLHTNEIVVRVRGHGAEERHIGDVPNAQVAIYKVADDVGAKLREFARENVHERADLLADGDAPIAVQPWGLPQTGDVVAGRYVLEEEIDRGGMGRVYRARDTHQGREVAIKMLDVPGLAGDDVMRARFLRKGELAVNLDHPNIVKTLALLTDDPKRLGIVMEFVSGMSLQQLLRQVALTRERAITVATGLLSALVYLDERDIVRLDLKPSSIMVGLGFEPIIVDLGLAKRHETDEKPITVDADQLIGTPAYLAPEIIRGGPVDIRADMFTVGMLLFEMLSGRPARRQGELFEVLQAASMEDVDVDALDVSEDLRDVMRRMLAREVEARFLTPNDARVALDGTPEGGGV
jgi:serine/threonine protein kinase